MHDRAWCGGWVVCVGRKEIHCQMLNSEIILLTVLLNYSYNLCI